MCMSYRNKLDLTIYPLLLIKKIEILVKKMFGARQKSVNSVFMDTSSIKDGNSTQVKNNIFVDMRLKAAHSM